MSDGGKGSSPRPYSVSQREYDDRWDAIFGSQKPKRLNDGYVQSESLRWGPVYVLAIVLAWIVGIVMLLP